MNIEEAIETAEKIESGSQDIVTPATEIEIVSEKYKHWKPMSMVVNGSSPLPLSETAQRQVAQVCGIPFRYWKKCRDDIASDSGSRMLADHANHWLSENEGRYMVRTVEPVLDSTIERENERYVRALVSDRYQPFSNLDLLRSIEKMKSSFADGEAWKLKIDEERLSFGVNHPLLNGEVSGSALKINDVVKGGVNLLNSEVGDSVLRVAFSIFRLVCLNGMLAPTDLFGYRRRHMGSRRNTVGIAQQETPQSVIENVNAILCDLEETKPFEAMMQRIEKATQAAVKEDWTHRLRRRFQSVTKGERESIEANFDREGDTSLWGAVNAITYAAHTAGTHRGDQLQSIGGEVLSSPKGLLEVA